MLQPKTAKNRPQLAFLAGLESGPFRAASGTWADLIALKANHPAGRTRRSHRGLLGAF